MLGIPASNSDDNFDPVENTRLVVSACPATDDRLETGTTPSDSKYVKKG